MILILIVINLILESGCNQSSLYFIIMGLFNQKSIIWRKEGQQSYV